MIDLLRFTRLLPLFLSPPVAPIYLRHSLIKLIKSLRIALRAFIISVLIQIASRQRVYLRSIFASSPFRPLVTSKAFT